MRTSALSGGVINRVADSQTEKSARRWIAALVILRGDKVYPFQRRAFFVKPMKTRIKVDAEVEPWMFGHFTQPRRPSFIRAFSCGDCRGFRFPVRGRLSIHTRYFGWSFDESEAKCLAETLRVPLMAARAALAWLSHAEAAGYDLSFYDEPIFGGADFLGPRMPR
jgi:hypothetical protein